MQKLADEGSRSVAMHGDRSQNARERASHDSNRQVQWTLVATDVAARGLDLDDIRRT